MCKGDKENKANKTVHRVAKRWGEHKFTKITSFQKGNKKRKKERNIQTWRIRIHFSLQSEIFKVSL